MCWFLKCSPSVWTHLEWMGSHCGLLPVQGNDAEPNTKWNCIHKLPGRRPSTISFLNRRVRLLLLLLAASIWKPKCGSKGLPNYKLKVNRIECLAICLWTWKCLAMWKPRLRGQLQIQIPIESKTKSPTGALQVHVKSVCQRQHLGRVFFQLVLICMQTDLRTGLETPEWSRVDFTAATCHKPWRITWHPDGP